MTKKFGFELLAEQICADVEANVVYWVSVSEQNDLYGTTPIERLLAASISRRLEFVHEFLPGMVIVKAEQIDAIMSRGADQRRYLWLQTQAQLPDWRVDFILRVKGPADWHSLIIECDGHDFHERTKEQAARDRARDRQAQELGFEIFRFTGSEIWRDPSACAKQVISWVERKYYSDEPSMVGQCQVRL